MCIRGGSIRDPRGRAEMGARGWDEMRSYVYSAPMSILGQDTR